MMEPAVDSREYAAYFQEGRVRGTWRRARLRSMKDWNLALPLGNGRMGAMIFGGTVLERISLNEDTCWRAAPGQSAGHLE